MLVLKLCLIPCGHLLPLTSLRSPSGHTAGATVVYGSLLAIWVRHKSGKAVWTAPVALLFALLIGGTRLALGVHSPVEVLIGGSVGLAGAVLAVMLAGPPPTRFRFRRLALPMLIVVVIFHGVRLPAEVLIAQLSFTMWPFSECR
jgi:membrane-associated phospholipid phosphatase